MQTVLDEAWPPGRRYYNKAHNVARPERRGRFARCWSTPATLPTPVSNIAFQQLHGAAARVPADATAFPHRYDHYDLLVHPATDDPADDERIIRLGAGVLGGAAAVRGAGGLRQRVWRTRRRRANAGCARRTGRTTTGSWR